MSPDLRLVADAAQGDPDEFAAQGAGDRVAQGCFAGPGRPGEAEDRAFGVRLQLAHRQVFDDALLGLFQTVVVVVQDFPGFPNVQIVLRAFIPGEGRDPVQVGGGNGVLGRGGMHSGKPFQFPFRFLPRLFRQILFRDFIAVLLDLDLGLVRFAKLLLDRLELLAEVILPLALVHVALDLGLDLAA